MTEEREHQTSDHLESTAAVETPDPGDEQAAGETPGIDLERVRDLVLSANPDVVPEMVQGQSFDELMASVEPAREAFQRIVSRVAEQEQAQPPAPRVAAQPGRRGAEIIDIDSLSPLGKISEGLRRL